MHVDFVLLALGASLDIFLYIVCYVRAGRFARCELVAVTKLLGTLLTQLAFEILSES